MSRRWLLLTGAAGAVLLAGCSVVPSLAELPSSAQPSPPVSASPAPTSSPSPSSAPSDRSPAPTQTADPDSGFPECTDDTLTSVDESVTGQLDALAAGDFPTAFGYASEVFRSSVTLQSFRAIIESQYPEVANSTGHEVLGCRVTGMSTVSALVSVTGANGSTAEIDYRLVLEPDGWRVDGASTTRVALNQQA